MTDEERSLKIELVKKKCIKDIETAKEYYHDFDDIVALLTFFEKYINDEENYFLCQSTGKMNKYWINEEEFNILLSSNFHLINNIVLEYLDNQYYYLNLYDLFKDKTIAFNHIGIMDRIAYDNGFFKEKGD